MIDIKDRDSNKVSVAVLPEVTSARADHFIKQYKKSAKIYTDENAVYRFLANHESVNYSVGQLVHGMAHTKEWSPSGRRPRGGSATYTTLSNKHPHHYVNEFAGRHNARKDNAIGMIAAQARNMAGKRLTTT